VQLYRSALGRAANEASGDEADAARAGGVRAGWTDHDRSDDVEK
jgi:hypothetical protein